MPFACEAVQPSELELGFFRSCQLVEKCDAQPGAHFGNEVWEAKPSLAVGHERRMCLEARAHRTEQYSVPAPGH